MAGYTQADRPIAVTTPLGKDVFLLTAIRGDESISHPFRFELDLIAGVKQAIRFDAILGQLATVEMRAGAGKRWFNGLIKSFSQGRRDENFVYYRAEIVPSFWLLTRKFQSRIFQQMTVPDILRTVLTGFDVSFDVTANYAPRNYCVQYHESDFDFASRLMEDEGIFYFFEHSSGKHRMIVTDLATQHSTVPGQNRAIYDEVSGGERDDLRITRWDKKQELRSGELTLWDHSFQLPGKHLEASEQVLHTVQSGKVTHHLQVGGNQNLEIYEYPGGYGQRFDGIDKNGATQSGALQTVFKENERIAKVRMEQEEAVSLAIEGGGTCGNFVPGFEFTLDRHFDADGQYLLTSVHHEARLEGNYLTGEGLEFQYQNRFTCIPQALPFRPQRITPKPFISGVQTATVVGPAGLDVFCDKYGRVKVQFHWDRQGKKDGNSSCWVRVGQFWAGKNWGAFFWPRIGHEVVVTFEEGNPDLPLIVGSVYNAENMPPMQLPMYNEWSGVRSSTISGQANQEFNGIVICDENNHEHMEIHSERHLMFCVEFDIQNHSGRHKSERVSGAAMHTVGRMPDGS